MELKKIEALNEGDVLMSKRTKELIKYLGDYKNEEKVPYATFRDKESNLGFHIIRKKYLLKFFEEKDNSLVVYN